MGKKNLAGIFNHYFLLKYWKIILPVVVLVGAFYWFILRDLPSPIKLSSSTIPESSQIYDRNGKLLYNIYSSKNQTFVPLTSLPKYVPQASIAVEDQDFYKHGPIDFRGIVRAFISTVFHKQVQGGSTITQQLVKISLLTSEQTIIRKIKEAILASATELLYPKDKILELYLNEIPYGGTAYGIEAASQTYFGIHAKDLDIAQAALLAGLPQAPTEYSPFGPHPEEAKQRQLLVLKNMEQQGYITKEQETKAENEALKYQNLGENDIKAPHFVLYIKDLLEQKYGAHMVEQGGLRVTTSLDLDIQNYVQNTVATEIAGLKNYDVSNGAAMVTNPATGEILAMVGSRDYFDTKNTDGNVNVTLRLRQPGSSIKPINYVIGLLKGYTAATPFVDEPTCFPNINQPPYCPQNYDGKGHGVEQMRFALGNSLNIPAVKMLKLNGVDTMIKTATDMGITTFDKPDLYGLSLTLGGGEVTMTQMMVAYGVFANAGYRIDLHPILKVTDRTGKVLDQYNPLPSPIFGKQVLPSTASFIISSMLSDNGARLMDFGPNSSLYIPKKTVAAKTGTTNDFRDNWTFGYTPSYVVGVWVGNNDNTPMSNIASGITGAAPIWNSIMTHLIKDKPDEPFQAPSGVIQKAICSISGLLPANNCPTRFEYFISGTEPKITDPGLTKVWIDKSTQDLAKPGQTDNVELKDEQVITDPTGDRYCTTCNHPIPSPTPTH